MKLFATIFLALCLLTESITALKRKKFGVPAERCLVLSSGKVFWPSDYSSECNAIPICHGGYRVHKEVVRNMKVCCCIVKRMEKCPACDMSLARYQTFENWVDMHLKRNGPQDGICPSNTQKRLFYSEPGIDKCCCEPRNSHFANVY